MSYELCLKCNESRRRRSEMRLPLRAAQSNAGLGSPVERGQTVDWNSSWAHGSRALAVLRWGSGLDEGARTWAVEAFEPPAA